jgi:hypothetical protein
MCSNALIKFDTLRNKAFHWATGNWASARESITQHACVRQAVLHRQTQHNVKAIDFWLLWRGRMRPALRPGQAVVCNIPYCRNARPKREMCNTPYCRKP